MEMAIGDKGEPPRPIIILMVLYGACNRASEDPEPQITHMVKMETFC